MKIRNFKIKQPSTKTVMTIACTVALLFLIGRLARNHFNASAFICAGTDFVDSTKTLSKIIIQPGQGYDGQFFYRYALLPFDTKQNDFGVHIDHPAYRLQRIGYPFLAWLFSFGGIPNLVPYSLILVNLLAFLGIVFYLCKLILFNCGNVTYALIPLCLSGLYMSFGRDLSEVLELFFFTVTLYYLFANKIVPAILFMTCALFTRDTSLIALLPIAILLGVKGYKKLHFVYFSIPFIIFGLWKFYLHQHIPQYAGATSVNVFMGIPFNGIILGFLENCNLHGMKNKLQLLFYTFYLLSQMLLAYLILRNICLKNIRDMNIISILSISYIIWLVFAICLTDNIYGDDWGFERVFSLWDLLGFLIIILSKKKINWLFLSYFCFLACLTIMRLIIRL